jgi:hypothetical protein
MTDKRSSSAVSGAYVVFPESHFGDGVLAKESTRRAALWVVFERVFRARMQQDPTADIVRTECCLVRSSRSQAAKGSPLVSLYHKSLPLVRLYRHGERYEVHALRPDCTLADLTNVVVFDEVFHNKVAVHRAPPVEPLGGFSPALSIPAPSTKS